MNPKIIARNKAHLFELIKNATAINNYWYNFGNKKARGKAIKSYCLHNELGEELDVNETVEKKKIKL
jgi:hypothetical protein